MSDASSPQAEYTQEVRFAIVMYGGVSLAIYINGVAQELLRMVRSTSQSERDEQDNPALIPVDKLKGTERIYRRLSYLLSDPHLLRDFRSSLEEQEALPPADDVVDRRMSTAPVNTRFVVDILSGTSAGGINAIYLAKALANDQQLDELKQLWVSEGDIALLINDKKSTMGLHLANQDPPQSLLNSRRMYLKLLRALQGMEAFKPRQRGFNSPHVDELDLFITTTDIQGLTLPLRLSDTIVYEKRHRNVFHFKYENPEATGKYRNDFLGTNDPFMAFAARCTSSFPFAFEPMRLCDIDEVLDLFPQYRNDPACRSNSDDWKAFFRENVDAETGKTVDFTDRSFGDGGYLDNKPFTFATETLSRRDAPVLVDRKLIYIEPSPEHPEDELQQNIKPQALENVKAALLDLPTYETIREDLQRLMDRNGLLRRVNRIARDIEGDLDQSNTERPALKEGEWVTFDLADMTRRFGPYYIPYRRLRISDTTDQLAKLVARAADLDENSAHFTAVRYLIRAWREINYPDYHSKGKEAGSEAGGAAETSQRTINQFLADFDFKYWLRRMTFIRSKVDQLYK
ncbi:MAG: patatin-like protein, partial [Acidobacteriota bacterium]|nr:patatin-like protein [Acidobacteriota bacterium]